MRTYDNRIKYYELLMKYDDTSVYKKYDLPEGFHYEFYKPGDEEEWVRIHIESGEFTSVEMGLKHFHDFYDSFIDELQKRCVFIVDNITGEKVGTATISLLDNPEYGYNAAVDWVAIKKKYQGKHLSKPLISKFMEIANSVGHNRLILHTQTTTWLAAKLYLDYGFEILNKEEVKGQIEFENVVFKYDDNDKPTIKNFTAVANPGEKIAIVGPTGAGKTTIVKLLMRFYNVTDGEKLIDGKNVNKFKRSELRKIFGMVLQDAWLFEGTIKENIRFGKPDATDEEIYENIEDTVNVFYL